MVWKPAKALGLVVGLIIAATCIALDVFLFRNLVGKELDLNLYATILLIVLSLPLLVIWGYWYYRFIRLQYYLDRNALIIDCGTSRRVVAMRDIRRIVPGDEVTVTKGFRGVSWPGFLMGRVRLKGLGWLLIYSTEPLERQLVVVTDDLCYGISPQPAEGFLLDFAARRALEPMREVQTGQEYTPLAALPVWGDRWFWGALVLAFVANAVLYAVVANAYGRLPERLPLGIDVRGQASHIASKSGILVIPGIGALTLLANGLLALVFHRSERLGAYLLAGMGLFIQVVLWLATMGTLSR